MREAIDQASEKKQCTNGKILFESLRDNTSGQVFYFESFGGDQNHLDG